VADSAGQPMSPQTVARIAGAAYLLQMALGISGFAVRASLGVAGDAAATARNIASAERLYRLSLLGDLLGVATVLVVTWALYVLLRPAQRELAALAVLMRLVENAILAAMAVVLLAAVPTAAPAAYLAAFDSDQAFALGRLARGAHLIGFNAAFLFLGLGSAVFAYALLKARLIPSSFAVFGVVASVLLAMGAATTLIIPTSARIVQAVSFPPMFLFEVGLGVWLLVRGVPER
jgi:hypothetical protein